MKIILPIKPEFVNEIFNNKKKYEFRKRVPIQKISKIIIYETFPTKKIVGEFEVEYILSYISKEKMWDLTKNFAGINKKQFFEYFSNSKNCFAFKIKNVKRYQIPKKLSDYGINFYPQSFVYIN